MPLGKNAMRCLLALAFLLQPLAVRQASGDHWIGRIKRLVGETKYRGEEPMTGQDCAMERLAENIDWLEHHVDTYGSIVAKQPDIWGEARLTKHRDEYEQLFFREINKFQFRINATISQADSSFLKQALALSNAASDTPNLPAVVNLNPGTPDAVAADLTKIEGVDTSKISLEPVLHLDQLSRYLGHLNELRRVNEGDDTSDSPGYSLNLVRVPISISPGKLTRTGFGAEITLSAEPVLTADLMSMTFRNLVINDLVDQLGLPIVRAVENDNDLAYATRLYDDAVLIGKVRDEINSIYEGLGGGSSVAVADIEEIFAPLLARPSALELVVNALRQELHRINPDPASGRPAITTVDVPAENFKRIWDESFGSSRAVFPPRSIEAGALQMFVDGLQARDNTQIASAWNSVSVQRSDIRYMRPVNLRVDDGLARLYEQSMQVASIVPSGRVRRAINPINPSFVIPVLGLHQLRTAASFFNTAYYGRHIRWSGYNDCGDPGAPSNRECRVHLLDARRWLRAELSAAIELFEADADNLLLFDAFVSPSSGLAAAIRGGRITRFDVRTPNPAERPTHPSVEAYRHAFFRELHRRPVGGYTAREKAIEISSAPRSGYLHETDEFGVGNPTRARNAIEVLAWAVVVESALLNKRLNEDVRKVATAKECYELPNDQEFLFYLPEAVKRPGLDVWPVADFVVSQTTVSEPIPVPAAAAPAVVAPRELSDEVASDFALAQSEAEEASKRGRLEELRSEYDMAAEVFQNYVRCRWPVHVFALDPVGQDQNVADSSSRKRELQFALSLAFVTGQIGANSLTQYSRDLQTEINTIGLNRTVSAFSHGPDTFGWRFYPRVQALDVPRTLGTLSETLFGTPRDRDLRKRQIEPGVREAVAIVLMPSFVPYVDVQTRSNWFKLTNAKNVAPTMKDTVRMSRAITSMRTSRAQCVRCSHLYRPGELSHMLRRVDQLDRELPLQSMRVQAPYENTLGGFEMFNSGVTDLGPELIGWHGAPGVVVSSAGVNDFKCGCTKPCECGAGSQLGLTDGSASTPPAVCYGEGTSLFLVGDNFSVHDTRVIAGGVCIPTVQLISRQIMRVTIPSCVNQVSVEGKKYVEIHVATPYGVTNHLHVPVCEEHCGASTPPEEGQSDVQRCADEEPAEAEQPAVTAVMRPRGAVAKPTLADERNRGVFRLVQDGEGDGDESGEADPVERLTEAVSLQAEAVRTVATRPVVSPTVVTTLPPRRDLSSLGGPAFNELKTCVKENWQNLCDRVSDNLP